MTIPETRFSLGTTSCVIKIDVTGGEPIHGTAYTVQKTQYGVDGSSYRSMNECRDWTMTWKPTRPRTILADRADVLFEIDLVQPNPVGMSMHSIRWDHHTRIARALPYHGYNKYVFFSIHSFYRPFCGCAILLSGQDQPRVLA